MKSLYRLTVLVLLFAPLSLQAQRFSKVTDLKVSHLTSKSKVKVSWTAIEGAQKYQIVVKDADGDKIASGKTKKTKKRFKASLFSDGKKYKVRVRALATDTTSNGKYKTKSYTHSEDGGGSGSSQSGELQTTNSAGRSGNYYLPAGYSGAKLPVMLAFHGSGGSGSDMVNEFSSLAEKHDFIIVAPSSRKSPGGVFTWEVGTSQGEITPDYTHALNCLVEVLKLAGVTKKDSKVLAVGYSGGGSSAPYLATNDTRFTHFASLHGGLFTGGIGDNVVRGWFSTGKSDDLRPPSEVKGYKTSMEAIGFDDVEYHGYSGGHGLSSTEKEELVEWWLN